MYMIIVSFDSGLERTGYSVFSKGDGEPDLITYGCIFTKKSDSLQKRLLELQEKTEEIIKEHKPDSFALEKLFFNKNITTGISVAQSQGAIIALAGKHDIELTFVTPQEIKMSLTGDGRADKKSIQKMVKILLNLEEVPKPDDTADAIACGLTYCTMMSFNDRKT